MHIVLDALTARGSHHSSCRHVHGRNVAIRCGPWVMVAQGHRDSNLGCAAPSHLASLPQETRAVCPSDAAGKKDVPRGLSGSRRSRPHLHQPP